jgi:hypothetical protein
MLHYEMYLQIIEAQIKATKLFQDSFNNPCGEIEELRGFSHEIEFQTITLLFQRLRKNP